MNVLPAQRGRRRSVLLQYLGVAAGGWLGGLLWAISGEPLFAMILLVPCTVLLVLIMRALRS